jgi:FlgD Ig-like domain
MRRLRPLSLALVALAIVVLAPSATATPPTIVQPANGTQVPSGWTGLIHVTWQETGDMKIEATGPDGYSSTVGPITVTPPNVGGTFTYSVAPMVAPGTYTISAGRIDGSEAPAQVTVTVPAPPDTSSATILAPVDGATLFNPWNRQMRVRFDDLGGPGALYEVMLDGSLICSYQLSEIVVGETKTCTAAFDPGIGQHQVDVVEDVSGTDTILDQAGFNIEPHLAVQSLSRSTPLNFYPYVRDGYRDRARFRFTLNKEANVTFAVRNRSGRVVRRVNLGFISGTTWDWNGRGGGGSLVPLGRYRVTLEARASGELRRATREVVVTRGWRTRYGSKSFCGGCGPGGVERRGNCYVQFDWFEDGDIFLDCWGGTFAGASWVFRVPSTTFRISKSIRGTVMCCAPGDWASIGVRRNARTYVVAAGVSGWRSWQIRSVRISYAYRQRI